MRLLVCGMALVCFSGLASGQEVRSKIRLPNVNVIPAKAGNYTAPHYSVRSVKPAGRAQKPYVTTPHFHTLGVFPDHVRVRWDQGRWRHKKRDGRDGWWWDVGGVLYYYPKRIDGPPTYISQVRTDDAQAAPSEPSGAPKEPEGVQVPGAADTEEAPPEVHQTIYYRPGDFAGVPYKTIQECSRAREEAGNVGICVMK